VRTIAALLAGRFYGWVWIDPIVGVVGAIVIADWSAGLLRTLGAVPLGAVSYNRASRVECGQP
jgi:Co/Zn/Cd efflux system component